jgi:hypothetical protein
LLVGLFLMLEMDLNLFIEEYCLLCTKVDMTGQNNLGNPRE